MSPRASKAVLLATTVTAVLNEEGSALAELVDEVKDSAVTFQFPRIIKGKETETANGVATQYRDDAGTRVAVTVNDASVAGVDVVVRAPAR